MQNKFLDALAKLAAERLENPILPKAFPKEEFQEAIEAERLKIRATKTINLNEEL